MRVVFCDKCGCNRDATGYFTDYRWFDRFDLCLECENKLSDSFFNEVEGLDRMELAEHLRKKREKAPQGVDGASAVARREELV